MDYLLFFELFSTSKEGGFMKNKKMTYDVDECPPLKEWIILALQHVFAMFGATILVPILVNSAAGETVLTIPVALVTSGIGTLIYVLCTKGKSPVYLGSSFAYITPIAVAFSRGGVDGFVTGIVTAGLIYILFLPFLSFQNVSYHQSHLADQNDQQLCRIHVVPRTPMVFYKYYQHQYR